MASLRTVRLPERGKFIVASADSWEPPDNAVTVLGEFDALEEAQADVAEITRGGEYQGIDYIILDDTGTIVWSTVDRRAEVW